MKRDVYSRSATRAAPLIALMALATACGGSGGGTGGGNGPCGAKGNPCCDGTACNNELECVAGTCSAAPSRGTSNPGTGSEGDSGSAGGSPASTCSSDGSDGVVTGLFEETFSSTPPLVEAFIGAPTCAFCSDGSGDESIISDLRWRSAYSPDKSRIVVTTISPDGTSDSNSWVSTDGMTYYVGNPQYPSVFPRARDTGLSCNGAPVR